MAAPGIHFLELRYHGLFRGVRSQLMLFHKYNLPGSKKNWFRLTREYQQSLLPPPNENDAL